MKNEFWHCVVGTSIFYRHIHHWKFNPYCKRNKKNYWNRLKLYRSYVLLRNCAYHEYVTSQTVPLKSIKLLFLSYPNWLWFWDYNFLEIKRLWFSYLLSIVSLHRFCRNWMFYFSVLIKRLHINLQEKIKAAFHMIAIELQSLPSLLLSATKKKLRNRRDRTNVFLSDGCRNDHYDREYMWQRSMAFFISNDCSDGCDRSGRPG